MVEGLLLVEVPLFENVVLVDVGYLYGLTILSTNILGFSSSFKGFSSNCSTTVLGFYYHCCNFFVLVARM